MESLSPAIGSQTIRPSTTVSSENELLIGSVKSIKLPALACRKMRMRVAAQASNAVVSNNIDFSDPDWKVKYQREFEARFNLPHITDVFPDAVSYPSTFCLKMRTPISEDFAQGYPSDEEWPGYINNNDRVLLKTINYSSPTSAGAECIDPDCTWVEQWVHRAGPREKIYFRPEELKAAIVTCGGLCPGLNDVIRQIVITLEIYGVKQIVGIPFGYRGFSNNDLAEMPAHSAYHGIGIVKLMGRSSGFIAMHASLASGQIDICLIPEVPFNLHGPHGVLQHLKYLLETKGSAVVCIAEGAGQDFLEKTNAKDASGNAVLGDIGVHIQQQIKKYFKEIGVTTDVKYIDPTYMIRACRANASDRILCTVLGQNAVHGAFAGFSGITVGICNTHYVYFPIPEVIAQPKVVDPNSRMWHRCLTSTGQPDFL